MDRATANRLAGVDQPGLSNREARAHWDAEGKGKVNALLWEMLPGETTLLEAEALALWIHDAIDNEWREKKGDA